VVIQRQAGEYGAGWVNGKADEPADTVGFVFVQGAVHPFHAGSLAAEGQHSGDRGLSAAAAAAVDGAVGQAAGVHARQRAHRPDLGAVVGVGIGQGLAGIGVAVRIHRHGGISVLPACRSDLGVNLHIKITQGRYISLYRNINPPGLRSDRGPCKQLHRNITTPRQR
jgi:hypothetical protein